MGLAWDGDAGLVVIEAQAPAEDVEDAEETLLEDVEDGPDALRVLHRAAPGPGVRRAGPPADRGRAGRRARCAASRSTRPGTSARGRTATTAGVALELSEPRPTPS